MKPSVRLLAPAVATLLVSAPESARACAVCMGGDENVGAALNGAIFLMLGMLAAVFAGIGAVGFSIWRRRHHLPPAHFATGEF